MRYQQLPPPPSLLPWVECLWSLELVAHSSDTPPTVEVGPSASSSEPKAESRPQPASERITPDGCAELVFHFGDPVLRPDFGGGAEPDVFVVGTASRWIELQPLGRTQAIGVRFRPGGLTAFIDAPLVELTDATVEAEAVLGRTGRAIRSHLASLDPSLRLTTLAGRLERHLGPRRKLHPAVSGIVTTLITTNGGFPLDRAIRRTGLSSRQVQRLFRTQVGLGPKRLARIIRFQSLLARLHAEAQPRWADLAIDYGYFDQAHMTHEFQALAGIPPDRYLAETHAVGRHFTSPERMSDFYKTGAGGVN